MKNINDFKNKIILGDNVEIMKTMEANSVDLIFADPPYNMQLSKTLKRFNGSDFDGVDDEWDKFDSLDEYDKFSKRWLEQAFRVLKKNGSLWVIGSFQNIHRLGYLMQDMGAWIINEVVWEKSNPVPNFAGTRFVNAQETMLWVTKNKNSKFTFNYKTMKYINGGTQMKSVWKLPIASGNERLKDENGKKVHSTQKPLKLMERIIIATSNKGDTVLDPFSGSGTTAHAAKSLQRNYIGLELDKKYFKYSTERLKKVKLSKEEKLVNATFDIKPPKVTYMDLINAGYLHSGQKVLFDNHDFVFTNKGELSNEKFGILTPNKMCLEINKGPINSWDVIIDQKSNKVMSEIRTKYRVEKLGWKEVENG